MLTPVGYILSEANFKLLTSRRDVIGWSEQELAVKLGKDDEWASLYAKSLFNLLHDYIASM
jgi:hypothetical protein